MGLFNRKKAAKPPANGHADVKSGGKRTVQPGETRQRKPNDKNDIATVTPSRSLQANGVKVEDPAHQIYSLPQPADPSKDPAGYLRSIHAVREQSQIVLAKAKRNELTNFRVDMSKLNDTAAYVTSIIKVNDARLR